MFRGEGRRIKEALQKQSFFFLLLIVLSRDGGCTDGGNGLTMSQNQQEAGYGIRLCQSFHQGTE